MRLCVFGPTYGQLNPKLLLAQKGALEGTMTNESSGIHVLAFTHCTKTSALSNARWNIPVALWSMLEKNHPRVVCWRIPVCSERLSV